jgi:hypothetical protein
LSAAVLYRDGQLRAKVGKKSRADPIRLNCEKRSTNTVTRLLALSTLQPAHGSGLAHAEPFHQATLGSLFP